MLWIKLEERGIKCPLVFFFLFCFVLFFCTKNYTLRCVVVFSELGAFVVSLFFLNGTLLNRKRTISTN